MSWLNREHEDQGTRENHYYLHHSQHLVRELAHLPLFDKVNLARLLSLWLALVIGFPTATPSEFKNPASFALGSFQNCEQSTTIGVIILGAYGDSLSEWLAKWLRVHSELPRSSLDYL